MSPMRRLLGAIALLRLSRLSRLIIAAFAFLCAWLLAAALAAVQAPDWAMLSGGAVVMVSVVAVIAALHLWTQAGTAGETGSEGRGDEGGGGPRRLWPDAPQPGGVGSDPSWWPEFERGLALLGALQDPDTPLQSLIPAATEARWPGDAQPETPGSTPSSSRSRR